MSQYKGHTRTNYFHVTDEAAFRAMMSEVVTSDNTAIHIRKQQDDEGRDIFAFGCHDSIEGIYLPGHAPADETTEPSYPHFIQKLQECLAENDAVIITEVGHEKLNYLVAAAALVGKHKWKRLDFNDITVRETDEVAPNWPEGIPLDY